MVRNWAKSVCVLPIIVAINIGVTVNVTVIAADVPQIIEQQHEAAVEQARNGDIPGGLKSLDAVIDDYPDYYPAKRDFAIIATWNGDCTTALIRFNVIRNESPLEGYLVEPIAECLRDLRQLDKAMAVLKASLAKNPEDEAAKRAIADLREYIRFESMSRLDFRVSFNEPVVGDNEWQQELTYNQEISNNVRGYYHHLGIQSKENVVDISRASVGLLTWFGIEYLLDVAVISDLKASDRQGGRINLSYFPNRLWELNIGHNSLATTPLRARKTDDIAKTVSSTMNASYHTPDYKWEWSANYGYSHISDTNRRNAFGTSLGYAYDLQAKQEQRVILELSRSRNSLDGAAYYNPKEDWSATLNVRISHVYDTDWERMVDHFTLYTGVYNQTERDVDLVSDPDLYYGSRYHGGARYQIEIEFSNTRSLALELDYASRVYDGANEHQTGITISYSQKL